MAHAGPSEPAQPSRKQHSRLQRALRRYFALLAALLVIVLVGAGCSVTQPAKAHERNDRQRQRQHQRPTTTAAADEDDGDEGEDEDATTTTDPAAGGQDTTTTVDPNATTTTVDPNASTTTVDPNATTTTVDPNATTTTVDPNAPLPFSTTECDPAGLPEATGQQTDEIGGPVCNTGIFGVIPGPNDTPSVKITAPENGDTFAPGEAIPCEIEFANFQPGTFDGTGKNGQARQFGLRPFSVNANGDAIGHAHCYIRDDGAGPTDQLEQNPIGFVALNQASADGRTLAGTIATGVANPGTKKFCVDLAGGNHMTFPKGVAQRFPGIDCVTIEIQ